MNYLENKNLNIENMKDILQTEYLNFDILKDVDMNPEHYINHLQFAMIIKNYTNMKDPHFYSIDWLTHKNCIRMIHNNYGHVCVDINFTTPAELSNLLEADPKKIVLDIRSLPPDWYNMRFAIELLCVFNNVKNKIKSMGTIVEYKKDKNINIYKIYYKNNAVYSMNYENGKNALMFKLNDIKSYDCDEVVCITNKNNTFSYILNKLGIPVYTGDENTNIDFTSYKWYDISGYRVLMPDAHLVNNHEYKVEGKIKNEFYPNI